MSFELAIRLTEVFLGLVLIQQSLEHLRTGSVERGLFVARLGLAAFLAMGLGTMLVLLALLGLALVILVRFGGPYNGGSDRLGTLILLALCGAHYLPEPLWQEMAFGYLAAQLILSYFISGWVKIANPDWRRGQALRDVFSLSAYPVTERFRRLADYPKLLLAASWAVIGFELAFPLAFVNQTALIAMMVVAGLFHLANAWLFGLNRFFWTWLAAYPSLFWLHTRLLASG